MTSVSWKASVPKPLLSVCPEMTTIGVLSINASVMPVMVLVAPGPDVTKATPTRPVTGLCPCPKLPYDTDPAFHPVPYFQVFGLRHGFLPNLSIIDLLFNMGPESRLVLRHSIRGAQNT